MRADVFDLNINGESYAVSAAPDARLLDILRDLLGLKATRFGCGDEACGACMVLVSGKPVYACTLPLYAIAGRDIITAEGLGRPDRPDPLQQAFINRQAGQCGYCLSGILISAKALLSINPKPTRSEIAAALDGHLCRCGAHNRILDAVQDAAALNTQAHGKATTL